MSGAKVVGIHGGSSGGRDAKPLPTPLVKLRELTKQHVHSLLRALFDGADDALFAMADKAGTNNEQTVYFDAMRELRLQKKQIATSVVKAVIRSFNEVGHYRAKFINQAATNGSIDELSLIQNEDLEIRVAVEGMVNRLRANAGRQLSDLQQRVESFFTGTTIEADQVPASPEALCDGFMDGCAELDIDIRAQLVVLKLFERFVLNDMAQAYEDSNALLVQLGVMPSIARSTPARTPNKPVDRVSRPAQAPVDLGDGAYYEEAGSRSAQHAGVPGPQLEDLRNLLHHAQGLGVSSGGEIPTLSDVFYSQTELVSALSAFQGEHVEQLGHHCDNRVIDFRALLNQRLGGEECRADYSEMDSDVMNLVSMLFEFILDDRQLQPAMKALIARLQIPILKVALMDRNFFNRGGHPARKLLNAIASAAIGWNEPEAGKVDRLKDKIESIVESILDGFEQDLSLFGTLLEDFSRFIDQEKRRGQLVEQRTKDSENGKAANEVARKAVQDALNESINGRVLPETIKSLLEDAWSSVMVLRYLKDGEHSDTWLNACQVVDELLWSIDPQPLEEGTRVKLLRLIPGLMSRMRAGFKDVAYDEFKAKAFLKSLEDLHVKALQELQSRLAKNESAAPDVSEAEDRDEPMHALTQRQKELAEQEDAIADLVKSTMELEQDFKNMKGSTDEDALTSANESDVLPLSSQISAEQGDVSNPIDAGSTLPTQAEADTSESEEIVLVSLEPTHESTDADPNDPFVKQVEKFAVGCWFEFQSGEHTERCKLAAIIKATGKYIFVNRAGIKVAEKTKMGLSVELRRGSVQILNDGLLFDRALESIITNLRGRSSSD